MAHADVTSVQKFFPRYREKIPKGAPNHLAQWKANVANTGLCAQFYGPQ
jgi:hypothetical protein